eukprot:CAMPEP_0177774764 /NCGR_PEP_ID=MMETSP0491_2-20121128/13711_1 /TAXON_ID=63592 /ORGANISM="Tetraselmis chuii, Strain PLY429" /LENGTH=236 /DNA_ID=CAMNT_0019293225 /DNA_START=225 /DNA_END=935 /DNA_ORIENTATION=+
MSTSCVAGFPARASLLRPAARTRNVLLTNQQSFVVSRASRRCSSQSTLLRATEGSDRKTVTTSTDTPDHGGETDAIDVQALVAEVMDGSKLGSRGELLFVGQSVLVALSVFTPDAFDPVSSAVGVISLLGGTVLAGFAFKDLGNSLSPLPKPREGSKLVTTGVYSYARHPMYAGLNLVFLGVALLSGSRAKFLLFLALLVLVDKKASLEERFLAEQFGEDWTAYASRVSKIVPFFY